MNHIRNGRAILRLNAIGQYLSAVLLLWLVIFGSSTARAEDKIDIIGYKLGMTEADVAERLKADGFQCRDLSHPDDFGLNRRCQRRADEEIDFRIAENLSGRPVAMIRYIFMTGALEQDIIKSLQDQYRVPAFFPGATSRRGSLPNGSLIEFADMRRGNPKGPCWLFLTAQDLLRKNEEASRDQYRAKNPSPRF